MFPPLPSGNNPAIGAAAQAGSAAASIYNALQSAANQHADLLARKKQQDAVAHQAGLQRDFENQLQLSAKGAVPTQTYPNGPPLPGRPTLMTPEANPAAQGAGQTITDPSGNQSYIPTQLEKDMTEGKTFRFSKDKAKEANDAGLTSIRPDTDYPVSILGGLNQTVAAWHKQTDTPKEPAETFHFNSTDYKNDKGEPVLMLEGTRGTIKPPDMSHLGGAVTFKHPEKAPKNLHFEADTEHGLMRGYDPESGQLKSTAPGGTRREPRDPNAPKPPSPAELRLVTQAKAKELQKATDDYAEAVKPPGGDSKLQVPDKDKRAALIKMRKAHQQAQIDYEESLRAVTGNDIPHNDWADRALEQIPPEEAPGRGGTQAKVKTWNQAKNRFE